MRPTRARPDRLGGVRDGIAPAHFRCREPAAVAGFFVGAVWPHACARLRIHLSPVSPANLRLSPVLPGTTFFNDDNGLRAVFPFVPGVPGKKQSHPEGSERAANVAGPSWGARMRVIRAPLAHQRDLDEKGEW